MLKKIFLSFFLLFSFVVYAEKEQDIKEIEIRLRNGQKNKDGTTTYKTVVTRYKGN
jgi:ATP/ADP translocase